MKNIKSKNKLKNKRVICAMSGGIDSSVAAALLKKAGFEVIGVFMRFWSENRVIGRPNECCSPEAEKRTRKVAKILKIPFYVFDFKKEFEKKVVDYFLDSHKKGLTPNPCVVCNKQIKFGLLLEKALKVNADFVATGHYARTLKKGDKVHLLQGADKEKDQSYFLWQLNQKQLSKTLFPIGRYKKTEIRKLAKKFKLPVFDIPESMEICFIQTSINDFLRKHLFQRKGKIINQQGKVIGKHLGLWFYTIGQRKGLGISGGPYYVLDKKFKKNILIVTKNEKDLFEKELTLKNVNWILGKKPKLPKKIKARIRYRHKPASATLIFQKKTLKLIFNRNQRAITPGQSAVFYKNQEVLGGAIIY